MVNRVELKKKNTFYFLFYLFYTCTFVVARKMKMIITINTDCNFFFFAHRQNKGPQIYLVQGSKI